MNKSTLLKTVMIGCALILIAVTALNVKSIIVSAANGFSHEKEYTAGNAVISDPVRNLDINWTNGKVDITYHKENTVTLTETSKKEIRPDDQMLWWLDGDTLRVQYAKPRFFQFSNQEKELTITLPEGSAFDEVSIDATSATLSIPSLQAETLNLDVTSGDILASAEAKKVSCESTSGDAELNIKNKAEEISFSSTSGDIKINAAGADEFETRSTSGLISVTADNVGTFKAGSTSGTIQAELGEAEKVKAESTSGNISLQIAGLQDLDIDATSGDVTAILPAEPGFTAHFDTTSGNVDYELPLTRKGSAYVCGDGSASVKIDTTSGDIKILPID